MYSIWNKLRAKKWNERFGARAVHVIIEHLKTMPIKEEVDLKNKFMVFW